jgi:cell wall-associated NlpC family hydrolase
MTGKKQLFLFITVLVLIFLFQGCASLKESKTNKREIIVRYAKNMLNKEYRFGAQDPYEGFDCSGLAQFAYREAGVKIARTSKAQYAGSRKIAKNDLEPADLIFFSTNGSGASHVGIFVGNGKFIHAPSAGKKVQSADIDNSYWRKSFYGAGTYLK